MIFPCTVCGIDLPMGFYVSLIFGAKYFVLAVVLSDIAKNFVGHILWILSRGRVESEGF